MYHSCNFLSDHPFLIIRPIKQEILSLNPRVVIFHDIISVSQANHLKSFFDPSMLFRSTTTDVRGQMMPDPARISKQQWIFSNQDKKVDRLSNLVRIITGLNMDFAEPWQILNYGI